MLPSSPLLPPQALAHVPNLRRSLESLLATFTHDDLLRYHWPLLGVTPTRPALHVMGYLGGGGRQLQHDGMEFLHIMLPSPEACSQLPNEVRGGDECFKLRLPSLT